MLRQPLLPGLAVPALVDLALDLALDEELGELAALGLRLHRHQRGLRNHLVMIALYPAVTGVPWCRVS